MRYAGPGVRLFTGPLLRATSATGRGPSSLPELALRRCGRCFGETGVLLWRRPCPHYQPASKPQFSDNNQHLSYPPPTAPYDLTDGLPHAHKPPSLSNPHLSAAMDQIKKVSLPATPPDPFFWLPAPVEPES